MLSQLIWKINVDHWNLIILSNMLSKRDIRNPLSLSIALYLDSYPILRKHVQELHHSVSRKLIQRCMTENYEIVIDEETYQQHFDKVWLQLQAHSKIKQKNCQNKCNQRVIKTKNYTQTFQTLISDLKAIKKKITFSQITQSESRKDASIVAILMDILNIFSLIKNQVKSFYSSFYHNEPEIVKFIDQDFDKYMGITQKIYKSKKNLKQAKQTLIHHDQPIKPINQENQIQKSHPKQQAAGLMKNVARQSVREQLTIATTRPSTSRKSYKSKYKRYVLKGNCNKQFQSFEREELLDEMQGHKDKIIKSKISSKFMKRSQTAKKRSAEENKGINSFGKQSKVMSIKHQSRNSSKLGTIQGSYNQAPTINLKLMKSKQKFIEFQENQEPNKDEEIKRSKRRVAHIITQDQQLFTNNIIETMQFLQQRNDSPKSSINSSLSKIEMDQIEEDLVRISKNRNHLLCSKKGKKSKEMLRKSQEYSRQQLMKPLNAPIETIVRTHKKIKSKIYLNQTHNQRKKKRSIRGSKRQSQAQQNFVDLRVSKDDSFELSKIAQNNQKTNGIFRSRNRRYAIEEKNNRSRDSKRFLYPYQSQKKAQMRTSQAGQIGNYKQQNQNHIFTTLDEFKELKQHFDEFNDNRKNSIASKTGNSIFFSEQEHLQKKQNKKLQLYLEQLKLCQGLLFTEPFSLEMVAIDRKKITTFEHQRNNIFVSEGQILSQNFKPESCQIHQIGICDD